jgi:hypothetical protein
VNMSVLFVYEFYGDNRLRGVKRTCFPYSFAVLALCYKYMKRVFVMVPSATSIENNDILWKTKPQINRYFSVSRTSQQHTNGVRQKNDVICTYDAYAPCPIVFDITRNGRFDGRGATCDCENSALQVTGK